MIYSFIRAFSGSYANQYYVMTLIWVLNIRFCIRCTSNALGSLTSLLYAIAGTSITLLTIFLLLCSDVKLNHGPTKKRKFWFNFSICHSNLNDLTAHSFEKVNPLEAYNVLNKFHKISLSESFLDSSIWTKKNNLKIKGYKMVRADHPNNVKREDFVLNLVNFCQFVILPNHI